MIVLLFGPPGCGKGTQSGFIADRFQIPAISTGEIFRAECKAGTEIGQLACSILARGELVGDDIVNQIVVKRLAQPDCTEGFLLDGYPRTVAQAIFLNDYLKRTGRPPAIVLHLDVPDEALVARLTARRQCPECKTIYNLISQPPKQAGFCDHDGVALLQRQDDNEATIRQRLAAYHDQTGPVTYYLKRQVVKIDGNRAPEEIQRDLAAALESQAARAFVAV